MLRQMENKVTVKVNGKEFDINKKPELKECIVEIEKERDKLINSLNINNENGVFGFITDTIAEQLFNALDNQIDKLKKIYDNMPDESTDECTDESTDESTFDWDIIDWNDPAWYKADDYLTDTLGSDYDDLPDKEQYRILKTIAEAYKWLYANM